MDFDQPWIPHFTTKQQEVVQIFVHWELKCNSNHLQCCPFHFCIFYLLSSHCEKDNELTFGVVVCSCESHCRMTSGCWWLELVDWDVSFWKTWHCQVLGTLMSLTWTPLMYQTLTGSFSSGLWHILFSSLIPSSLNASSDFWFVHTEFGNQKSC